MRTIILLAVLTGLSGCATTNKDPLEGLNRGVYKFNDVTDRYALRPVAQVYKSVAPSPVRSGITNFFSNLGTLTTIVNDLLQLKFAQAFTDAGRFVINSTFGVGGLIDVASMDKIEKHNEDFGQTLGYWGVGSGAYIVLPILGPSTIRDAAGLAFDTATSDPITYFHNTGQIRTHNQIRAVQLLDKRTQLLDATDLVDNASIDPYAFMRDAYLQRRASQVQDGLVPAELLQDGFEPAEEDAVSKALRLENSRDEKVVTQSGDLLETQVKPLVSVSGVENVSVSLGTLDRIDETPTNTVEAESLTQKKIDTSSVEAIATNVQAITAQTTEPELDKQELNVPVDAELQTVSDIEGNAVLNQSEVNPDHAVVEQSVEALPAYISAQDADDIAEVAPDQLSMVHP